MRLHVSRSGSRTEKDADRLRLLHQAFTGEPVQRDHGGHGHARPCLGLGQAANHVLDAARLGDSREFPGDVPDGLDGHQAGPFDRSGRSARAPSRYTASARVRPAAVHDAGASNVASSRMTRGIDPSTDASWTQNNGTSAKPCPRSPVAGISGAEIRREREHEAHEVGFGETVGLEHGTDEPRPRLVDDLPRVRRHLDGSPSCPDHAPLPMASRTIRSCSSRSRSRGFPLMLDPAERSTISGTRLSGTSNA